MRPWSADVAFCSPAISSRVIGSRFTFASYSWCASSIRLNAFSSGRKTLWFSATSPAGARRRTITDDHQGGAAPMRECPPWAGSGRPVLDHWNAEADVHLIWANGLSLTDIVEKLFFLQRSLFCRAVGLIVEKGRGGIHNLTINQRETAADELRRH